MPKIRWIHFSDWHQQGNDFDRSVVRDALVSDVRRRSEISADLTELNFCIFTGDLAYRGNRSEFDIAFQELIDPILEATAIPKSRFLIAPGNHDQNLSHLDVLPSDLHRTLNSRESINEWLGSDRRREALLNPFREFREAVEAFYGKSTEDFLFGAHSVLNIEDVQVSILTLNSSLLCGQHKEDGKIRDRGFLILGEPQYHSKLEEAQSIDSDLIVAAMHHPFDWLQDSERSLAETRLMNSADFLLFGHNHSPRASLLDSTTGLACVINAGACYDRRFPAEMEYACSYNYVVADVDSGSVDVFFRRYNPRFGWQPDTESLAHELNGHRSFIHQGLVKRKAADTLPVDPVTQSRVELQNNQMGADKELSDLGSLAFVPPPRPVPIVGREDDLNQIETLLSDFRIVVVEGIAGTGKSEVAAILAERVTSQGSLSLWLECKPNLTTERFDLALTSFATSLSSAFPLSRLRADNRSIPEKLPDVIEALNISKAVLFLDDFHMVDEPMIATLLDAWMRYAASARLVLITREKPACASRFLGRIGEHIVQGLAPEYRDALMAMYRLKIEDPELNKLVLEKLDGHPLATALFASLVNDEHYAPRQLIEEYRHLMGEQLHRRLFSDVYSRLKPKERRMLGCLSVFRDAVERSGLLRLFQARSKERPDALVKALANRFLVRIDTDQRVRTHPLIREFCYSQVVNQRQEKGYHAAAAKYFLPSDKKFVAKDAEQYLEAHYHLQRGGWSQRAVRIVILSEAHLCAEGYNRQLLSMYAASERDGNALPLWSRIYRKRIYERLGEVDKAEAELMAIKSPKADSDQSTLIGEFASFYYSRADFTQCISFNKRALELNERIEHKGGLATYHFNLGVAYDQIGSYENALFHLSAAEDLSGKTGDELLKSRANIYIQEIRYLFREVDNSDLQDAYEEIIEVAEQEGDHPVRMEFLLRIGGDERVDEAIEVADRLGDRHWQIEAARQKSASQTSFDKELEILKKNLADAENIKRPTLESSLLFQISNLYAKQEQIDLAVESLQQAIKIENSIGRKFIEASRLNSLGNLYAKKDDQTHASIARRNALELVTAIGLVKIAEEWQNETPVGPA